MIGPLGPSHFSQRQQFNEEFCLVVHDIVLHCLGPKIHRQKVVALVFCLVWCSCEMSIEIDVQN